MITTNELEKALNELGRLSIRFDDRSEEIEYHTQKAREILEGILKEAEKSPTEASQFGVIKSTSILEERDEKIQTNKRN